MVGKRFEDWPLRLCLVGGSGRHDPHPMTCDGQTVDQRSPARAIDQIMAGTGPCALVFHAYGSAKAFGSIFAEAMMECIRVPFTIWGGDGLVSNLLPPPSFLQSARSGWTRLVRFQGIDMVLKLPAHPTRDMKISIILDGLNASGPLPTDDILLGAVLWIANGTMWGATTTTYGATMQEVSGNTYFTGELGSSQMSSYRNALLAWPNSCDKAEDILGGCFGPAAANACRRARGRAASSPAPLQDPRMVHDLPADMLYLRHVFLMALGICTLTDRMDIEIYARSAGTHTALALAAHLPELNREWGHLLVLPEGRTCLPSGLTAQPDPGHRICRTPGLELSKMVLCGGAAPIAYWTAGRLPKGNSCLIQYCDDQLCPLDVNKLRDLDILKIAAVTVPHPKLAYLLLGRSLHSYMHLCVSPHTIHEVAHIPDTIPVVRSGAVPSKPGELLERLCRLGMTPACTMRSTKPAGGCPENLRSAR